MNNQVLEERLRKMAFSNMVRQLELPEDGDEYEQYPHKRLLIAKLKEILEECRGGDCARADILDLGRIAGIPLEKVGCDAKEVLLHHRAGLIQIIQAEIARVRNGEYSALDTTIGLVVQATSPILGITLAELGTSAEEIERFREIECSMRVSME